MSHTVRLGLRALPFLVIALLVPVVDGQEKKLKELVWSHAFDKNETTHRRSACVNDYHGNFSFYAPALPAGTYQLTIQVVDETIPNHRRVARKSQVFRVTPVANSTSSR